MTVPPPPAVSLNAIVIIAAPEAAAVGQEVPCVKVAPVPDDVFKLNANPSPDGAEKFP